MVRDFKDADILAVYIDGIQIAGHHIVAALVQHCRTHKIRNVLERIADERVRTPDC
jgi:hypothetical protein